MPATNAPKKTDWIKCRVTPAQLERIRARAEAEGRSLTEWLRDLVLRELARKSQRAA